MSAFFFFDNLEVIDPIRMDEYVQRVKPVVEKFGGVYRTVGGKATTVEGELKITYPVLIEFPSTENARAWYDSPEYAELKALRQSAARNNGVLIEGI